MHTMTKKCLAIALCVSMGAAALSGCSKKEEKLDTAKTMISLDGASMDAGTANLILRYEQAAFENGIGQLYTAYFGLTDLWNTDLYGNGEMYSQTFKEEQLQNMERMLLDEKHAEELGVTLTTEEEEQIKAAAAAFLKDNADYADALEAMSATEESVENMLRLYTLHSKAQEAMSADVDTEVSDEEAAQKTVAYYRVQAVIPTEEESEAVTEGTSEDVAESALYDTESTLETETELKTQAAAETEGEETAAESIDEVSTEAETEGETESAEKLQAREVAAADAESFLAKAADAADAEAFQSMAEETADGNSNATSGTFTFGEDDAYPEKEVIEAAKDLEDNTLVSQVVVTGDYYYVLYVTDAFDEDATEEKKEEIVETRKREAIEAKYTEWTEAEEFTVDTDAFSGLLFNVSFTEETETETEGLLLEEETEGMSETMSEGLSESVAELAD